MGSLVGRARLMVRRDGIRRCMVPTMVFDTDRGRGRCAQDEGTEEQESGQHCTIEDSLIRAPPCPAPLRPAPLRP